MIFLPATHRGRAYQRGHGLGGLFSGLIRFLTPLVTRGAQVAARAYENPHIKELVKTVQKKAVDTGVNAINKLINPKKPAVIPAAAPPAAKKRKFDPSKRPKFKTKGTVQYSKRKKDPHALF